MDTFWSLLKQSIITQSLVTLVLIVTVCVMWATGKPVTSELYNLTILVIAFWFGSKVGHAQGTADTTAKFTTPQE
jgi:multisubunit Na+/H+ antiporter MnhE subunit